MKVRYRYGFTQVVADAFPIVGWDMQAVVFDK